jgi:hypothetical protein
LNIELQLWTTKTHQVDIKNIVGLLLINNEKFELKLFKLSAKAQGYLPG